LGNGAGPSGEGRNSKVAILSSLTSSSSSLLVVAVLCALTSADRSLTVDASYAEAFGLHAEVSQD
jgi:hypothetical protein